MSTQPGYGSGYNPEDPWGFGQLGIGYGGSFGLSGGLANMGSSLPEDSYAGLPMSSYSPEIRAEIQMGRDQRAQWQEMQDSFKGLQSAQQPSGFEKGVNTAGTIIDGLASLASIYTGLQSLKLNKEAFRHNREVSNTNLNNSILDYNRRLNDTLSNRALNTGQGQGWVSEQLAKYSAKRG